MKALLRRLFGLQQYSREFDDRLTGRLLFSVKWFLDAKASGRVLDVGASNGWFERLIGEQGDLFLTGIDLDKEALAIARKDSPHAEFVEGSALALPFADGSFDAAVMFEVIEHVPEGSELAALREVRRVLRNEGCLFLSTPIWGMRQNLMDPAWYFGHRHYSIAHMKGLIRQAGFTVISEERAGAFWESVNMTMFYPCKFLFGSETPFKSWFDKKRDSEFVLGRGGENNMFLRAQADTV